jgi:hypothetical protein
LLCGYLLILRPELVLKGRGPESVFFM